MKHMSIPPSMMGYKVRDGRLINEAPELVTGIDKAVMLKRAMKRADKVRMIAEGNELANANIDLFKKI
jgi:hypothetical protein|tara:strand:+ start:71 stop:274 length:204 start_codon:yes stop_codon:yes gene_type:complete